MPDLEHARDYTLLLYSIMYFVLKLLILCKILNIFIVVRIKNVDNQYVTVLQKLQNGDYPYVSTEKHNFVKEISAFTNYNKKIPS